MGATLRLCLILAIGCISIACAEAVPVPGVGDGGGPDGVGGDRYVVPPPPIEPVERVVIGPGAPADAPMLFSGDEDPSRAPEIVYPSDGVLVPPNLNELEFHFRPGRGNDLFEFHFQGAAADLHVYVGCEPLADGCAYVPDEETWTFLAGAERGRDAVTYELRGVSRSGESTVGRSVSRALGFAEQDVTGGIYYWSALEGTVYRYDFGRRSQTAETYMDARRAGAAQCVGCHTLSRDGTRIALGLDIPAPAPYKVFDVGTRNEVYAQGNQLTGGGSSFFSFSPDTSRIMTSNGATIVLRDASTGMAITDPVVENGTMPDWSPDGNSLVFARPEQAAFCFGPICGLPDVSSASIESMRFNGTAWTASSMLVPFDGMNSYYPSFSPDGAWVIFNRSPSNEGSLDMPDAQVWTVPSEGGTPMHLASASNGGDSWPKWAPVSYSQRGSSLLWFTFSTRRAIGLRPLVRTEGIGGGRGGRGGRGGSTATQIWMAGFDVAAAVRGEDPSLPAFWLPFQNHEAGNHIAQWVLSVERQECGASSCPEGEFCDNGVCVPIII